MPISTHSALPFARDYATQRARFLAAATQAGGALSAYDHPLTGPDGGPLATDVARWGAADASRLLIVISGTHGAEAAYGSACQTALLAKSVNDLPDDMGILMIHTINLWGAA